MKSGTYSALLKSKLDAHLNGLERDSLLKRSDVLFAVCHPPAGFRPIRDYEWDRLELERLDQLRHDLVHSRSAALPSDVDKSIQFMVKTGLFFWSMLNAAYNVKMNPLWMLQEKTTEG